MAQEIELKLALSEAGPAQLHRHPLLRGLEAQRHSLANTYYDTPARALEQHRIALRLRVAGDRVWQTVKTAGSGRGGLHARGEWEWPVEGERLDLAGLRALPLEPFQDEALLNALQPAYRTDFERTAWQLGWHGTAIELACDSGAIIAGAHRCTIRELELELRDEAPDGEAALWSLADTLAGSVALRPANMSKAARAVALRDQRWTAMAALGAPLPPAAQQPLAHVERAITALDAYTDSGDDALLAAARDAFAALAQHDDAALAQPAAALAQALTAPHWLTPTFGRTSLALLARLAGRSA